MLIEKVFGGHSTEIITSDPNHLLLGLSFRKFFRVSDKLADEANRINN